MLTVATAPAKQQSSPLLTLPVELLALVISHASNAELKSLRVASKHLCALSEPQLFQSIVLVSSIALLDKFRCLFERSHLRSYVQRLVYDDRLSSLSDILAESLQAEDLNELRSTFRNSNLGPAPLQARYVEVFDCLRQDSKVPVDQEVEGLSRAIRILPSLTKITVLSGDGYGLLGSPRMDHLPAVYPPSWIETVQELYERKYAASGLIGHGLYPRRDSTHHALLAARSRPKPLTEIRVMGSFWQDFFGRTELPGSFGILCSVFVAIRLVDLSFYIDRSPNFPSDWDLVRFGALLTQATDLEVLKVDFGVEHFESALFDRWDGNWNEVDARNWCMLSRIFPGDRQFKRLRQIEFTRLLATENGLIAFLEHHSATLRSLSLRQVDLVRPPLQRRKPCWLRVIKDIQAKLSLQQVTFDKALISGRVQWTGWYPSTELRFPGCLMERVEQFILCGGDCPIPDDYNRFDREGRERIGDRSWAFNIHA